VGDSLFNDASIMIFGCRHIATLLSAILGSTDAVAVTAILKAGG
jgi:NhaP-type Na+/H+ and K+/H+ antiporter